MVIRLMYIVVNLSRLSAATEDSTHLANQIMDLFLGSVQFETAKLSEILEKEAGKDIVINDLLKVTPEVEREAKRKMREAGEKLLKQKNSLEEALEAINLLEY